VRVAGGTFIFTVISKEDRREVSVQSPLLFPFGQYFRNYCQAYLPHFAIAVIFASINIQAKFVDH